MSAVQSVNSNAEVVGKAQALMVNIGAAKGLQGVLKSNLGKRHALVSARSLHDLRSPAFR